MPNISFFIQIVCWWYINEPNIGTAFSKRLQCFLFEIFEILERGSIWKLKIDVSEHRAQGVDTTLFCFTSNLRYLSVDLW